MQESRPTHGCWRTYPDSLRPTIRSSLTLLCRNNRVAFGTSGHRGSSFDKAFNERHTHDTSSKRLHGASGTAAIRGGGSVGIRSNPMATMTKTDQRELHEIGRAHV